MHISHHLYIIRCFICFLLLMPPSLNGMELTPYQRGVRDYQEAEKVFEQCQHNQNEAYRKSAPLYCQALQNFTTAQNQDHPDITEKIEACAARLNLTQWGLLEYPTELSTLIPTIKRMQQLNEKKTLSKLTLPLGNLEEKRDRSPASDSPLSHKDSAHSSSTRSASSSSSTANSSETTSVENSDDETPKKTRRKSLAASRSKSPLSTQRISRNRSQSTLDRPLLDPAFRVGVRNLRDDLILPSGQNTNTTETTKTGSVIITSPASQIPQNTPPKAPLAIKVPSDETLQTRTPRTIIDHHYEWASEFHKKAKKYYSDGTKKGSKKDREAAYRECLFATLAAVQNFLTARANGCEEGLIQAIAASALVNIDTWRLSNYPAGTTHTLIHGIWEQISLYDRSWAFLNPPSEKK